MNVREADSGSCLKPDTACCAATYALLRLTVLSRLKSSKETAKGSSAGEKVAAPTVEVLLQCHDHSLWHASSPLYTMTLGIPNVFFTRSKALTTSSVLVKSLGMFS